MLAVPAGGNMRHLITRGDELRLTGVFEFDVVPGGDPQRAYSFRLNPGDIVTFWNRDGDDLSCIWMDGDDYQDDLLIARNQVQHIDCLCHLIDADQFFEDRTTAVI
jgi:hypothetical protein